MKNQYELILISADGEDYVTDCEAPTKEGVLECASELGSRWYFYPYNFLIRIPKEGADIMNSKILNAGDMRLFNNKTVRWVMNYIKEHAEELADAYL